MDIRARVHQKFADGSLPRTMPVAPRARDGRVDSCSGCDDLIIRMQTEYAFDDPKTGRTFRFHAGCYALWVRSVRRAGLRRASLRRGKEGAGRRASSPPHPASGQHVA